MAASSWNGLLPLSAQHRLSIQGKATANITSSSLPTSCSGIHHRLFWGLVCIAPYYKYQSLFIHFCVQSTRPLGPAHSWPSLNNYKIEVGLMHGMPSASCILTTDGEGGCGVSTCAQPWLEPKARCHICLWGVVRKPTASYLVIVWLGQRPWGVCRAKRR